MSLLAGESLRTIFQTKKIFLIAWDMHTYTIYIVIFLCSMVMKNNLHK